MDETHVASTVHSLWEKGLRTGQISKDEESLEKTVVKLYVRDPNAFYRSFQTNLDLVRQSKRPLDTTSVLANLTASMKIHRDMLAQLNETVELVQTSTLLANEVDDLELQIILIRGNLYDLSQTLADQRKSLETLATKMSADCSVGDQDSDSEAEDNQGVDLEKEDGNQDQDSKTDTTRSPKEAETNDGVETKCKQEALKRRREHAYMRARQECIFWEKELHPQSGCVKIVITDDDCDKIHWNIAKWNISHLETKNNCGWSVCHVDGDNAMEKMLSLFLDDPHAVLCASTQFSCSSPMPYAPNVLPSNQFVTVEFCQSKQQRNALFTVKCVPAWHDSANQTPNDIGGETGCVGPMGAVYDSDLVQKKPNIFFLTAVFAFAEMDVQCK